MNCSSCNAEVTSQDKYCPACGAPLSTGKKGDGSRKPVKRAYEEASTQLVDVDEFRKYMAEEKAKVGLAGSSAGNLAGGSAGNLAGGSAGNLAGGSAGNLAGPEPVAPAAAPSTENLSPSSLKATGTFDPAENPTTAGTNPLMYVIVVIVLAVVGYVAFVLSGPSQKNESDRLVPGQVPAGGPAVPGVPTGAAPAEGAPAGAAPGAPAPGAPAPGAPAGAAPAEGAPAGAAPGAPAPGAPAGATK